MSTQAVVPINQQIDRYADPEMVRTLKETVCKGATDSQFRMFIEICRGTGLNPFLREIWYVPSVGVMAARDGYLRVANEHPAFDGMQTTVERDAQGIPIKATCSVWRKDRTHPVTCEAYYDEYKKGGNVWQTYKSAMISKVAEVLALKRSFSINGVVSEEEIGFEAPEDDKPKRGSRAAAQSVAVEKIKALEAGATPAQASAAVEHIIDAETEEIPDRNPPADADAIPPADQIKFSEMMAAFKEMKTRIGDEAYYRILSGAGVLDANKIRPLTAARKVYKVMLAEQKMREDREEWTGKLKSLQAAHTNALGNADAFWTAMGAMGYDAISMVPTGDLARVFCEVEKAVAE